MNRITRLKSEGVKGLSFDIPINPVALVVGPPRVGKTAITAALKLGLLGSDPKLGTRNEKLMQLAAGGGLEVLVGFQGGQRNTLKIWNQKGANKRKEEMEIKVPAMMLDARAYFEQSGPERMRQLFALSGGDDLFDVTDLIAKLKTHRFEPHTKEADAAMGVICDDIDNQNDRRTSTGGSLNEFFVELIASLSLRRREADTSVKMLEGSIQANAALEAGDGITSTRAGIDKIVSDLSAAMNEASANEGRLLAILNANTMAAHRYGQAQTVVDTTPDQTDAIADIEKSRDQIQSEVLENDRVYAEMQQASTAQRKARGNVRDCEGILRASESLLKTLKESLEKATADSTCPHCGKVNEAHTVALAERVVQATKKVEESEAELAAAKQRLEKLGTDPDLAAIVRKGDDLATALRQNAAALREAQSNQERRKNALALLAEKPSVEATEATKAELEEVRKLLGEIVRQLDAATEEQREAIAAAADARRREQANVELEGARIKQAVAKAAIDIVIEEQRRILAASVGGLMKQANRFFAALLGFEMEFRDGEIGYFREGTWVSSAVFSGSEEALTYAGFSMALAVNSPVRVVVLDEMFGNFSPEDMSKVLSLAQELCASGELDNFVGVTLESALDVMDLATMPPMQIIHVHRDGKIVVED